MAPAFVKGAHTKGNEVLAALTITAPAAGNTLIAFLTKTTEPTVAPTFSDNTGGTWTVNATKALSAASANGTWMGTKVATGSETEIKGTGGTVGTLAYEEVSGLGALETITNADNIASGKEGTITFTGGKAGSYYIVCNGSGASCGTAEAWGGTGPTLTNAETALAAKNYTGHAVLTEPISAKTAISKHSAASTMGMLAVVFAEVSTLGYIAPITPPTFFSPRRLSMPRTWEGVPVTVEDVKQASATLTLKTADTAKVGQLESVASALTLKAADTAKAGQVEGTQSSLTLKTADSAKAGQVSGANTAIGMKAATTDKASQQISGKATVTVTFQAAAHAVITSAVAAKTGIRFELAGKAAAEVGGVLQISSKLGIMFGASATPASIAKATANLNVTMTIHATIKKTEGEVGRRVTIFMFEE